MKKYMLMSLVIAFLIATVASSCLAQTPSTFANTSKKGSLLIFPLIRTDAVSTPFGLEQWETLVTIANDYPVGVWLTCVVVDKNGCTWNQEGVPLTGNQVITFRASDGSPLDLYGTGGFTLEKSIGEVKCWASRYNLDEGEVDETYQISFNHLSAEVTLLRTVDSVGVGSATYSAWRFAANRPLGQEVGTPGELLLTGVLNIPAGTGTYDACPGSLIFDFLRQTDTPTAETYPSSFDNYVALVPCKQDFTQAGGGANMKIDITRWNENERPVNGALCLSCFFADSLANAPDFPDTDTPAGAFSATTHAGATTQHCNLPAADVYPVVGVILKKFNGFLGPIAAATPTGKGKWEPSPGSPDYKGVPAIKYLTGDN